MESRFDTLARVLAGGMSRREALRQLSGTTAGVVLAALGLGCRDDVVGPMRPTGSSAGPVFAAGGDGGGRGNSTCADFCNNLPPGRARGECVSESTHGAGLCIECGGDFTRVCPQPNGTFSCCPPGRVCNPLTGACVCPPGTMTCGPTTCCPVGVACCGDTCCGVGQICFLNSCRAPCPAGFTPCGATTCCPPGSACGNDGTCITCSPGTTCHAFPGIAWCCPPGTFCHRFGCVPSSPAHQG
jgi:hypothetical protein